MDPTAFSLDMAVEQPCAAIGGSSWRSDGGPRRGEAVAILFLNFF